MALSKILPASQEQYAGARNLLINGSMICSQRGTSETGVTSGGYYTVDRFKTAYNGSPDELVVTHEQSTDAPTGFSNSFKLTVTTAETTLAADERVRFQQRIEGQNLQHLKYGTSNAEYITLSFYVKSNVTGTYGVHLENTDSSRSVCASYTINAANTWEKKTISFAGDTTGSFDNDNNRSLDVNWVLAAGTNYTSGTLATSWEADTDANNAPSGQANIIDTVSNYFAITGVQLEVGEQATPFEHRSYGDELARCQRYGWRIAEGLPKRVATGTWNNSISADIIWPLPVQMRATPTLTVASNGALLDFNVSWHNITSVTFSGESTNRLVYVICSVASSGASQGDGAAWGGISGNNPDAFLDAEL